MNVFLNQNKQLEYYKKHFELLKEENKQLKEQIVNLELRIESDNKGLNSKSTELAKGLLEEALNSKRIYDECIEELKIKLDEIRQLEKDLKSTKVKAEKRFNKAIDKEIKNIEKR